MEKICPDCGISLPVKADICPSCRKEFNVKKYLNWPKIARITAGVSLIVNSLILIYEEVFMELGKTSPNSVKSIFFSIAVGIMVLSGKKKWLTWAQISIAVGAVVYTFMDITAKDYFLAVIQIIFSLSLFGLVFGSPMKKRTIACITGLFMYFFISFLGIYADISGKNIINKYYTYLTEDIITPENNIVKGYEYNYLLTVPDKEWFMRSRKIVAEEHESADIWIVNPVYDSHVIVICESLEGNSMSLKEYSKLVMGNLKGALKDFKMAGSGPLALRNNLKGMFYDVTGNIENLNIRYNYGLFVHNGWAFQVICFSDVKIYKNVKKDFISIINSFAFDTESKTSIEPSGIRERRTLHGGNEHAEFLNSDYVSGAFNQKINTGQH